jgi:ADP-heptose:LPS heptosyltransferase
MLMRRSDEETWLLNPRRRYILNTDVLDELTPYIDRMSDLAGCSAFNPLVQAPKVRLPGSSVLIDRYRDRGIGDLLFTTGPLAYMHHVTGGTASLYFYAYAERGAVLNKCPYLMDNSPLVGPILYSDLAEYDYHWFVETVTEFNEQADQLNVYDALYASLGIDPSTVDRRFKRPYVQLYDSEIKHLDDFFYWVFVNTRVKMDLRHTGYYVVAPLANSALRCAPYALWLEVIAALSEKRPVLVVGALRDRMPPAGMSVGDFGARLDSDLVATGRVLNLMGKTQLRHLMEIISKATAVLSLDSASLYLAQAFRTPCVSLWGSHDPQVRLGYDTEYMSTAIWQKSACRHSPCFAWQGFPVNRCPLGEAQSVCHCQLAVEPTDILQMVQRIEDQTPSFITVPPAP